MAIIAGLCAFIGFVLGVIYMKTKRYRFRCKDCVLHCMCKFERDQGSNGFCTFGERLTDG